MKSLFLKKSVYLILTPAFFIIHAYQEEFGYISIYEIFALLAYYLILTFVLYLILDFFFKPKWKNSIVIFYLQIIYFFFSSFHFWLIEITNSSFFSSYSFLLSLGLLATPLVLLFIYKKLKKQGIFIFWFNLTFSILICTDLCFIIFKILNPEKESISANFIIARNQINQKSKKNIYFLVFDEYASSISLKNRFNVINKIDTFLLDQKFIIIPNSISNYNFTPFSIASILNMSYLKGIKNDSITIKEYQKINIVIKNSTLIQELQDYGYQINNLSIFDFKHFPSQIKSEFLLTGSLLITSRTFFEHIYKDLGWMLFASKTPFKGLIRKAVLQSKNNDIYIFKEIQRISKKETKQPSFVYAHFNMPHPPYFYDSSGREREINTILNEKKFKIDKPSQYISQLFYTNKKIEEIVNIINSNENGNAIIIIAGDHGYRNNAKGTDHFRNMNAIYLPQDLHNKLTIDSISMVNEFRLILNLVFNQKNEYLKDSTFFLKDYIQ